MEYLSELINIFLLYSLRKCLHVDESKLLGCDRFRRTNKNFFCLSDAYDTDNLNFKWSNGPKADKVKVEDEELSQFTLLHTDARQGFQQYSDGKHHTC